MSLEINYVELKVAKDFKNWLFKYNKWMSPTGVTYSIRLLGVTVTWRPNHIKPKLRLRPKPVKATHEEIHIPIKEYYELKSMFDHSFKHWPE